MSIHTASLSNPQTSNFSNCSNNVIYSPESSSRSSIAYRDYHVFLMSFNWNQFLSLISSDLHIFFFLKFTDYFVECPSVWICLILLYDLCILGRNTTDIRRHMMSIYPITSDVNFDQLVKMVSAKFFHYEVKYYT